ncbi:MAG: DUF1925 domain-containing protein [Candidatus Moduliflexus flocculans]|nr:DUF1925 domain-containing protein [Candidatus Moduliflexus flocculans]
MMEWVLEPEEQAAYAKLRSGAGPEARRFLRGGFFRDFLRKYPESNHLHKRMVAVSAAVRAAGAPPRGHGRPLQVPVQRSLLARRLRRPLPAPPARGGLPSPSRGREADARSAGLAGLDYDCDGREELFLPGRDLRPDRQAGPRAGRSPRSTTAPGRGTSRTSSRGAARPITGRPPRPGRGSAARGRASTSSASALPPGSRGSPPLRPAPPPFAHRPLLRVRDRDRKTFRAGTSASTSWAISPAGRSRLRRRRRASCGSRGAVRSGPGPSAFRSPSARRSRAADGGLPGRDRAREPVGPAARVLIYGSEWNLLAFPHEFAAPRRRGRVALRRGAALRARSGRRAVVVRPADPLPIRGGF